MSKQFVFTVSFTAVVEAVSEAKAEVKLEALLDRLGQVDTPEGSWDGIDYDLIEVEG